jgi:tagaturonate reductase
VCRRPKGNDYTVSDDRYVLEFYWAHRNDSPEELVHAVMTNTEMWGQDLTEVNGFEEAAVRILKTIRADGAVAAYKACLA